MFIVFTTLYVLILIFLLRCINKKYRKDNSSTPSSPPMFEADTPTRQAQGNFMCFCCAYVDARFIYILSVAIIMVF